MLFEDAAKVFVEYIKATRSHGTYDYTKSKLTPLNRFFGKKDINAINRADFVRFIVHTKAKNPNIANKTLNKYLDIANRVIKFHIESEVPFEKLPQTKKIIPTIDSRV